MLDILADLEQNPVVLCMQETLLEFEWAAPLRRLLIGSGRRAIFKKGTKHPTATLEAVLMDDPEYLSRLVGKRNLAKVEKALSGPEVFLEDWPTTDADWPLTKVCFGIYACRASHL